jgi:hypothetical protein
MRGKWAAAIGAVSMVAMAAAAALNGRIGCRRIRGAATAGDHRRDDGASGQTAANR